MSKGVENHDEVSIDLEETESSSTYSNIIDDKDNKEEFYGNKSLKMKDLVEFDVRTYGQITKAEKIRFLIFSIIVILSGIPLLYFTITEKPEDGFCKNQSEESGENDDSNSICIGDYQLLLNAGILVFTFLFLGIVMGIVAVKFRKNVGYTRKSLHFASFFLPFIVNKIAPIEGSISITLLKFWFVLFIYLLATKIVRRKLMPVLLIFRAIDRHQDRPNTLKWMVTQFVASSIVAGLTIYLWEEFGNYRFEKTDDLMLIIILIIGLGDGLAEPVGVKFGKHKYTVRAWRYRGVCCAPAFTRSFEGSATVLLVSLITTSAFYNIFSPLRFVILLLSLPILMTLTEALSPRTWDSPFMFAVGAIVITVALVLPGDC
jgi:phytol kinase